MKKRRQLISSDTWVLLKRIGTGIIVIALVSLLIAGIWHGTRVPSLTIGVIKAEGGKTIQHSEVEKLAAETLEGTYLGLVPKKFSWLFPEKEIILKVQEIERLHNVFVKRDGGTKLIVSFDEYVPKALWCESVDSDKCLFIDKTGYAFGNTPKLSGGSFLRFSTNGQEISIGETMTDEKLFLDLITLTELLAQNEWYVSHLEIDQVGDVFAQLVSGGELKIDASESPENTVKNLFTVLASEQFSHIEPGNFQYIDLRFGNKVYVNEELAVPEIDTASTSSTTNDWL